MLGFFKCQFHRLIIHDSLTHVCLLACTHASSHPPYSPAPICAGDLAATVRSVQTVDQCLGELLATADEVNARYLVTSDHGNADDMVQRDKKGKPLVCMVVKSLLLVLIV